MKNRIKQLRKTLDMTQQKFADAIGIKRNTVAQYEMGRNTPIDSVLAPHDKKNEVLKKGMNIRILMFIPLYLYLCYLFMILRST